MPIITPHKPQQSDPAYDPDRKLLYSKILGSMATGSDSFITEISKLGNGLGSSVATALGADKTADYFNHNVQIMSDFQKHMEQAKPEASKVGKYAAIASSAILTTPAIAGLKASLAAGYAGALSSALSDAGSNGEVPSKNELKHAALISAPLGAIGGVTGSGLLNAGSMLEHMAKGTLTKFLHGATAPVSRSTEAGIEGVDPNLYMPKMDGHKGETLGQKFLRTYSSPYETGIHITPELMVPNQDGMRG